MKNKENKPLVDFTKTLFRFAKICASVNNHNFLELMALRNQKKMVVRLVVTDETYPSVRKFCTDTGLFQHHSEKKQMTSVNSARGDTFTVGVEWDDPKGDFFVVIIGRTQDDVQNALAYENAEVTFEQFGKLYEYPSCCVKAYSNIEKGSDWIVCYVEQSPIDISGYYHCNRLAVLFDGSTLLPDFFPCQMACKKARELGMRYEEVLKHVGWTQRLRQIQKSLKSPILVRHGTLLQLVNSRVHKNVLRYEPSMDSQINLQGQLPLDDPFYRADALTMVKGRLRFSLLNKVIDEVPVEGIDNRLLLFN